MNIHISRLDNDWEFEYFLSTLLKNKGAFVTSTGYFSQIPFPGEDPTPYRRASSEQHIQRADLVIGIASPSLFTDDGAELRREWNTILINRRPAFMIVHNQPLPFISHVYVSVRTLSFSADETKLRESDFPIVVGSPSVQELRRLISDPTLIGDFEQFTYIDDLFPHHL